MKAISQLIVHVFDLVEAEGGALMTVVRAESRRAHSAATHLAMGIAMLLVAVPLLVAGCGLMATGLMWWIGEYLDPPLAAMITGALVAAVGAGCFWSFVLLARRNNS